MNAMPRYEYRCIAGHEFELEQSIHDPPRKRCSICGKKCKRLVSLSSFHLKGGGWYKDGYSSAAPAKPSKKKT